MSPKASGSPLPGLPQLRKLTGLKTPRRLPLRQTGPKVLALQKDPGVIGGPGEPPEGFVTAHTSRTEWIIYWALAKVLRDPPNPRKPPFVGGATWSYQKAIDGGRVVGGQVVDFVVLGERGNPTVGIRVQTEHFHIMTDTAKQIEDFLLKVTERAIDLIVDIFDQDFIADKTGHAACVVVANAIKGIQRGNPITQGTAQQIR